MSRPSAFPDAVRVTAAMNANPVTTILIVAQPIRGSSGKGVVRHVENPHADIAHNDYCRAWLYWLVLGLTKSMTCAIRTKPSMPSADSASIEAFTRKLA
jgi:hypothetical protein